MIITKNNHLPIWKKLFTDSVSVNKKYLTDSVSVNKKYLTDSGVPIEKHTHTQFIIGHLL